jgi:hypothetical protein
MARDEAYHALVSPDDAEMLASSLIPCLFGPTHHISRLEAIHSFELPLSLFQLLLACRSGLQLLNSVFSSIFSLPRDSNQGNYDARLYEDH